MHLVLYVYVQGRIGHRLVYANPCISNIRLLVRNETTWCTADIVILKNKGKEGGEQKLGGSYRNQYTVGQLIV